MPVIRSENRPPEIQQRRELVAELVGELTGSTQSPAPSPVIFELPSEVLVVWEKWRGLSHQDRASIILEAYERADLDSVASALKAPELTLTIGVTPDEAIDMSLLPFFLMSNLPRGHENYMEVERLLIDEGAIATRSGLELRFPSEELARQSREHLIEKTRTSLPDVHWEIGRTIGRDLDIRWGNEGAGT